MLFLASDANFPTRIQGCYVSNQEVNDVVAYIKENNKKVYDEEAEKEIENPYQESSMLEEDEPDQKLTPLEIKCLKFAIENGQASIFFFSKKFCNWFWQGRTHY